MAALPLTSHPPSRQEEGREEGELAVPVSEQRLSTKPWLTSTQSLARTVSRGHFSYQSVWGKKKTGMLGSTSSIQTKLRFY